MLRLFARLDARFALLLVLSSPSLVGCTTAELKGAPDAAIDACTDKPAAYCSPIEAGAHGCVADPNAAQATVRKLPAGSTYPIGCEVSLIGPDVQGECKDVTSCICVEGDAGAPSDGGDASPSAPPSPVWQCH